MTEIEVLFVALAVVPTVNVVRVLLPVKTIYVGNWLLAAVTCVGISYAAGLGPLRTAGAFGLSHVIQRLTRFMEAGGDAQRVQVARATRRM